MGILSDDTIIKCDKSKDGRVICVTQGKDGKTTGRVEAVVTPSGGIDIVRQAGTEKTISKLKKHLGENIKVNVKGNAGEF